MVNTEIWMGSGASVTFIPETDLFIGYSNGDLATAAVSTDAGKEHLYDIATTNYSFDIPDTKNFLSRFVLVNDILVGCIADFYENSGAGILRSSLVVASNSESKIYFQEPWDTTNLTGDAYVIIRAYGTPVPAPSISGDPALLADNWLGIINSITFPNPEVEFLQKNLALGGSRNFTHHFKGMETASGGSAEISVNHGAWLYYALGSLTSIGHTSSSSTHPTDRITGAANSMYVDTGTINKTGPIIYRSSGTTMCPPVLPSDTVAELDLVTVPTIDGNDLIATPLTYTIEEANGNDLPSFSLEYALAKSAASPALQVEDSSGDEVFVRVATGNMVNTLTLNANENEELKMTLDLNTKQIVEPQTGYYARKNVSDERNLINFGSSKGTLALSEPTFLKPFFFHDGSISLFGNTYLKIINFSLTIDNTLTDKRFIGQYNRKVKTAIPAQRNYTMTFSAHVTDKALFDELRTEIENDAGGSGSLIDLRFIKENQEEIRLKFDDYFVTVNSWPIPDDNSGLIVDWTIVPRTLNECTVKTHWILSG